MCMGASSRKFWPEPNRQETFGAPARPDKRIPSRLEESRDGWPISPACRWTPAKRTRRRPGAPRRAGAEHVHARRGAATRLAPGAAAGSVCLRLVLLAAARGGVMELNGLGCTGGKRRFEETSLLPRSTDRGRPIPNIQETQAVTDWDRIVREYGPLVFATAWRILGHVADTEDVVQEVFLQVHQLQRTDPIRHWGGLLRRLAACRALDRLRQRKNIVSLNGLSLVGPDVGPEAAAVERELSERLRSALAKLPDREAAVFC